MSEILTRDNKRLTIFEDKVVIDKKLPKWRNAELGLEKTKNPKSHTELSVSSLNNNVNTLEGFFITTPDDEEHINSLSQQIESRNTDIDADVNATTSWLPYYEIADGVNFDVIASAGIKELTRYIAENKLKFVIGGYGSLGQTQNTVLVSNGVYYDTPVKSLSSEFKSSNEDSGLFAKFKEVFAKMRAKKSTDTEDNKDLIDALQFFKLVKLTSKDSVTTYRDRVSDYLKAVYNAASVGQVALLEELIRGMVTNKYEAVLYSEGYYNIITEEQMVKFVTSCEKGIKLDYIKNFTRPLPYDVVDKVNKLNQLEIFDNYVVLYYDPDGLIYKETAREEAKRKDPILFGLIAGSNKLYYVADWIDEYCDLTLEKFIDAIGVTKEQIHMDYNPNSEPEPEVEKVSVKTTKKSKKRNYKKNKKTKN
jgi:hypothetical protein